MRSQTLDYYIKPAGPLPPFKLLLPIVHGYWNGSNKTLGGLLPLMQLWRPSNYMQRVLQVGIELKDLIFFNINNL